MPVRIDEAPVERDRDHIDEAQVLILHRIAADRAYPTRHGAVAGEREGHEFYSGFLTRADETHILVQHLCLDFERSPGRDHRHQRLCGFDDATNRMHLEALHRAVDRRDESLEAIGAAMKENGKVTLIHDMKAISTQISGVR